MEPARTLNPLPVWMTAPATRRVVDALSKSGAEVRFVGGCVRDALLGRPVADIDIATPEPPEIVIDRLHSAGIHSIPTGIAHGTITAVIDGQHFEITTLRVDVETYGRHAEVAFTDDWTEDAARRDFTMNALSCDSDGAVFDPWGGLADLEAGHVRFVGEAKTRIEEDHLRLLRFFRFHAWYGHGLPDEAALAACATWASSIAGLSGERLRVETLKLLAAPDPAPVVDLLATTGVLAHLLPGATASPRLAALVNTNARGSADPVLRLATLIRDADAQAVAERFRLSNDDAARLTSLTESTVVIAPGDDEIVRRATLYRIGGEHYRDLVLLAWADAGGSDASEAASFQAMLTAADEWQPIALPVRGADVLALGVAAGPRVGELLEAVEEWWIKADFRPDREPALEKLSALVADDQTN